MNQAFTFDDVLLVPNYNHLDSRREVEVRMTDKRGTLTLELPIISANMDTVTEFEMANFMSSKGAIGALHRFMTIEKNVEEFRKCTGKVFVSVGVSEKETERAQALRDAGADYFVVDVAHAHAGYVGKAIKRLREVIGDRCIAAGNVATYAGADYLAACGADLIKVGIGGGSACTTRIKTGFGVPTLFSVKECARVDRSIIADGGLRTPGDIVKALAFGADFVMLGGMLSGIPATPGPVLEKTDENGKIRKIKMYRGMASSEAHIGFFGDMPSWKTAEGEAFEVSYKPHQDQIIHDIVGGLRSGLTYGGAQNFKELQRKLAYNLITPAGTIESRAHGNQSKS